MFHDFKSELKMFLIVALVAAILAVGGVLLLKTMESVPSTSPTAQETLSEEPIDSQQLTIDTNDWQTYRNEEFGFEVRYPGIYDGDCKPHVETTSTGESIVRIGPIHVNIEDSGGVTLSDYADQSIQSYEKAKNPSYVLESRTDIMLGNKKAIQVVITWCGAGCNNPHTIYVERGSRIYEFVFDNGVLNHCPIKPNELPSETASQILSTFRFVE